MPKTLFRNINRNFFFFQIQGGINVKSARFWNAAEWIIFLRGCRWKNRTTSEAAFTFLSFHRTLPGRDLKPTPCEWKQISALSLHRPRSRKIQYLAYLRDQNLALWGRWRGRGTRRGRDRGAAACWPIDTPAPGCGMGCHARSGL